MLDHQAYAYRQLVRLALGGHRRLVVNAMSGYGVYEVLGHLIDSPHLHNRQTRNSRKKDVLSLSPNRLLSTMIGRDINAERSDVCFATPSRPFGDPSDRKQKPESGAWDLIIINQCKAPESDRILQRYIEQGLITDSTLVVWLYFDQLPAGSVDPITVEPAGNDQPSQG